MCGARWFGRQERNIDDAHITCGELEWQTRTKECRFLSQYCAAQPGIIILTRQLDECELWAYAKCSHKSHRGFVIHLFSSLPRYFVLYRRAHRLEQTPMTQKIRLEIYIPDALLSVMRLSVSVGERDPDWFSQCLVGNEEQECGRARDNIYISVMAVLNTCLILCHSIHA